MIAIYYTTSVDMSFLSKFFRKRDTTGLIKKSLDNLRAIIQMDLKWSEQLSNMTIWERKKQ